MDAERKTSSSSPQGEDREETLPLYEEFQHEQQDEESDERKPPPPSASADEVRDFIVHLLMSKRRLPEDYARRVAARWTIGTGQELRKYSPAMFLDIFGREDGWITYKEAHLCIYRDEHQNDTKALLGVAFLAAIWDILMGIAIHVCENQLPLTLAIIGLMFGGIALVGALIGACCASSLESNIENELAKATSRRSESN